MTRQSSSRPALSLRTVPDVPVRHDGTLELVDSDFMVPALDSRWNLGAAPASAMARQDLLLLDPCGHWAPGIMQALAETTGGPLSRVRVLSPVALREVAVLEEVRLPDEPGLPAIVRHLHARRLDMATPSPALARVWQRTRLAVLLCDPRQESEAARWLLMLAAQLRREHGTCPPWLVLGAGLARDAAATAAPGEAWLEGLRFGAAPPLSSVSAAWNLIFADWTRREGA